MSDRTEFEIAMIEKKNAGIPFTKEEREMLHGDCRDGITDGSIALKEYNEMLMERYKGGLWLSKTDAREAHRLIKATQRNG